MGRQGHDPIGEGDGFKSRQFKPTPKRGDGVTFPEAMHDRLRGLIADATCVVRYDDAVMEGARSRESAMAGQTSKSVNVLRAIQLPYPSPRHLRGIIFF